jgi:hypothetical protein
MDGKDKRQDEHESNKEFILVSRIATANGCDKR